MKDDFKNQRRRGSNLPSLLHLDKMKRLVSKKSNKLEKTASGSSLEVADFEELRVRFETETLAVENLCEMSRAYRDNALRLSSTGAKLADQFSLFYSRDHPRRPLAEKFAESNRDINDAIGGQMQVMNQSVLSIQNEFLRECQGVKAMIKARDEALKTVEKLERKHENTTHKSAKEEKVMYTGEMLKEAINSYALLHERAVKGVASCHDRIMDIIDPSLVDIVFLQTDMLHKSFQLSTTIVERQIGRSDSSTDASDTSSILNDNSLRAESSEGMPKPSPLAVSQVIDSADSEESRFKALRVSSADYSKENNEDLTISVEPEADDASYAEELDGVVDKEAVEGEDMDVQVELNVFEVNLDQENHGHNVQDQSEAIEQGGEEHNEFGNFETHEGSAKRSETSETEGTNSQSTQGVSGDVEANDNLANDYQDDDYPDDNHKDRN